VQTIYRRNNLSAALPPGQLESLAIPFESYKLAFTPGLLAQVFQRNGQALLPNPAAVLGGQGTDQGGYIDLNGSGHWWIPSGKVFFNVDADVTNPAVTAPLELTEARAHFLLLRKVADPFNQTAIVNYDTYDLLVIKTEDALQNTVESQNDYRTLQPRVITDPNGNQSAVAFDALGLVAGTALMGKVGENVGDALTNFSSDLVQQEIHDFFNASDPHLSAPNLLRGATTRIIYDLDCFKTNGQPVVAATLARETHASAQLPPQGLKIQISFSYSDGFGREIQRKFQAETGSVPKRDADGKIIVGPDGLPLMTTNNFSPRWVGSGWIIFNYKGKPIRQYEPFFTDRHHFEFDMRIGVSRVLFYDPVGRLVATLHPNHMWEKVVFNPWEQTTYDVNDTVLNADDSTDPKLDEDVKGFFSRMRIADYLPTWYEQRINLGVNDPERIAADKAAVHRQTPTVAHFDTLGRTFLTIVHNRYERNNAIVEEKYPTRVELDIEGNERSVRDAIEQNGDVLGRIVVCYDYDILANRIHQISMEAGERWMLNDVTGKPIRTWDSRGHQFKTEYDQLRRPLRQLVRGTNTTQSDPRTLNADLLFARIEYGEGQANDIALNLRTRVCKSYDGVGVVTSEEYDFKGNLLHSTRTLAIDYKKIYDWNTDIVDSSWEIFHSSTTYDALNRPLTVITPDRSIYRPTFNEANLLEKVDVRLRDAADWTPFVTNIDYNAKGQRTQIEYANSAKTGYEYDTLTFRLTKLTTKRRAGLNGIASQLFADVTHVQELRYTYDPAGNITLIADAALKTIFFNGQQVVPICEYTYDAVYRLIEAKGREHVGQTAHDFNAQNRRDYDFVGLADFIAHPNDMQAMRRYTESYEYDEVGNFKSMRHSANGSGWIRSYKYDEPSLIELTKKSNRLSKTSVGNRPPEVCEYDAHGNMTAMPHLPHMDWNFKDQLQRVDLVGGGDAYYVYDAGGQRIRKVVEKNGGALIEERIYIGGFEIFRRRNGMGTIALERQTLHIMGDKLRIALVETRTQGSDDSLRRLVRYQLGNHLASASLELDDKAQVISYEEYYPYGSTSYQSVRSQTETPKRYRYTGMERDEESGFNYHTARYCAPWLGRWVSCDPIGVQDGLNLYQYCGGNPVNKTDRMGLDEWSWNPLNIFSEDYTFNPGEYTYKLGRGFLRTGIQTITDTFTRSVDLVTMANAARFKMLYGLELPYTTLSPEARSYNADLSYAENIHKSVSGIKEGVKAFGELLSNKDPDAVGTLTFIVATGVKGKPPSLPRIPFLPAPQFTTAVTTAGSKVLDVIWQSTSISTETLTKFGGPLLAVAATNKPRKSSSKAPSKEGGKFKQYWNKQEDQAGEFIWRTEGKIVRREAEIWLEKGGKLQKTQRRLDALLISHETARIEAAEWSTPRNLSEGAAKHAQLQYQQELFDLAKEGYTIWARPAGEKAFYDITGAAQRTEVYPHWKMP
jgi:RHS repeat-associated protein